MRLPRLSLVAPLVALTLLLSSGSALGAANHPFLQAINGGYEDACGVALHDGLYVSDYYHDAIVTPTGKISDVSLVDGPCKLDLDSAGNLYVNNWHRDVVKYTPPFGTPSVIDSAQPTGLTVDQATGNLYVAHRTYVAEYGPTGTLISDEIGLGSLEEGYGVAVSNFPATAGYLYVPDAASHTIKVYDPAVELENPVEEMDGSATPQGGFTYLVDGEVAVDNSPTSPSYGHVFVLDAIGHGLSERPPAALDEFNAAGDYRGQIAGFTDAEPSGVAIDPTAGPTNGNVYVTSGNSESSKVFVYGPTAPAHILEVVKTGTGGGSVTSSPKGINCGSACTAEYNEEQLVILFITPDSHSVFTGWTVEGSEPCPGTEGSSCTVLLSADVKVEANFEEPTQETLTVSEAGSGSGTMTSAPAGISCPGDCTEHFNQGRFVTLTAHPDLHNRVAQWTGCDSQPSPTQCKVAMSAAKAVNVEFTPIPQLLLALDKVGSGVGTVLSTPSGISCSASCSALFDEGSTVFLTVAPAPTSAFVGFSGGGCSGTATICAVTMSEARSVRAEFLFVSSSPNTSAVSQSVAAGSSMTQRVPAGLSLHTLAAKRGAALTAKVPAAGILSAAGAGLNAVKARSRGAGVIKLYLGLSRAGRRALARSPHGSLAVKVTVAFKPRNGGAVARASKIVKLKGALR